MVWVQEIGFAFLWLFAQPLFYISVGLAIWTSYRRIKSDRMMYGHRVFPRFAEWGHTWLLSLIFGGLLSVGLIISGSMLSIEWMIFVSIIFLLVAMFDKVFLLSPAYTVSFAMILIFILQEAGITHSLLEPVYSVNFVMVSYLLIFLLMAEAVLIYTTKRNRTFPQINKGNRGKYVGSHVAKRLMIVPFLVPVPNGVLTLSPFFEWWPIFGMGNDGFSLMLFPFLIGYAQRFQGSFSEMGAKRTAKWLSFLIVLLVGGGVGAFFIPEIAIGIFVVALFGRLGILLFTRFSDLEKRPIFTPRSDGMVVVGVIPNSPADQMGIKIGEIIERIHDQPVSNEHEFFEVMSENRTYCKLTLRNFDGEKRFVQRSLYEGELHELGLIFVKETPRFILKTEKI